MTDSLADRERRQRLLREMNQLEDEIRAQNPELYDANQHWINNPLIKPQSKVSMFEEWEARVRKEERQKVIAELTEELLAIQEVGEGEDYCDGLRHGILFLDGGESANPQQWD